MMNLFKCTEISPLILAFVFAPLYMQLVSWLCFSTEDFTDYIKTEISDSVNRLVVFLTNGSQACCQYEMHRLSHRKVNLP